MNNELTLLQMLHIERCVSCDKQTNMLSPDGLCHQCADDCNNTDIDIDPRFVA